MKWRLWFVRVVLAGAGLLLLGRLIYWQVIKGPPLAEQADNQRKNFRSILAARGQILAADGTPLVTSRKKYMLTVDPTLANWIELRQHFPHLPTPVPGGRWYVVGELTDDQRQKLTKLNPAGIFLEEEIARWYPDASASSQLLGFVGKADTGQPKGYFGLEGFYDRELTGKQGWNWLELDALSRPILLGDTHQVLPQDGRDLRLSLDRTLQYLIHNKLQQALQKYQAVAGTVTVIEPSTGRILAMVSLPSYDPAFYNQSNPSIFRNPVIAETYEPGSTFKVLIMAAALDSGAVTPQTICPICNRPVTIGEYTIKTWNDKYYPNSTMAEVLVHSDNVGMVYVSRQLGPKRLLDYLHKFNFGDTTGVDLQEEVQAVLRPARQWSEIDYATASFGQGIAVTPLQMLQAVATLANGGKLLPPRLVDQVGDKVVPQSAGKQVISLSTATTITQMMVASAQFGEAKWTIPRGMSIAGKTGTAQIPVAGHYDKDKTIASFVGFAPAANPKFAMLVTLREPKSSPWGSETAAPLWFDIAKEIFRLKNYYNE